MIRGDRLKLLRQKKKLSQSELGKIIGVSKSTISCYENGTRTPSMEAIIDFIELYGVTSDYLLGCEFLVKSISKEPYKTFTKEDLIFIEELKKNKIVSELIIQDPKRTAELVKKKIG